MLFSLPNALTTLRKNTPREVGIALIACLLATAAFFFFLPYSEGYGFERVSLYRQWLNISGQGEDWQHCVFVPLLALAIALWQICQARLPQAEPFFPALIGIISSLALFYIGYRVAVHYIGFFALQGFLLSAIAFTAGLPTTRRLLFPLIFLTFAWPLPFLDTSIAFPLRIIMSHTSAFVLNGVGIPTILNGTGLLSAPEPLLGIPAGKLFSVDVADPCSGIRSLFALLMVSALYGYFSLKTWWQKLILFACSIPLAVFGNLIRILILTMGTMVFGSEFAIGKDALNDPSWFHMAAGYAVFGVALAGMIGISSLLQLDFSKLKSKWTTFRSGSLKPIQSTHQKSSGPSISRKRDDEDVY